MGKSRLFNLDVALKELRRRQEALDLAKNLSGLSKEARALYEARLERMGISVARLKRLVESEGARGQFGSKRVFTADMISGGTATHQSYPQWPGLGINWDLQQPHHGGGGLAVQEAIGFLPPWKQYWVLQELEASGRFPGQQLGKGMYPLIVSSHVGNPSRTGKKGKTPLDFGTPGDSAHGMPVKGRKLVLNPNASVTDLVKKISSHMDEFDALNDAKLKESNRILSVLKDVPEGQQVKALQQILDDPKGLEKIYGFTGGERKIIKVGTSGSRIIYESSTNDGSRAWFLYDPTKGGKGAWEWISPKNAAKLGATILTPSVFDLIAPNTISAATEKAMGGNPDKPWGTVGEEFAEEVKNNYIQGLPFALGAGLLSATGKGAALAKLGPAGLVVGGTVGGLTAADAVATGVTRGAGLDNSIYEDGRVYNPDRTWQGETFLQKPEIAEVNRQHKEARESGRIKAEGDDPLSRTISSGVDAAVKWITDPGNEIEYHKNQAIKWWQTLTDRQ